VSAIIKVCKWWSGAGVPQLVEYLATDWATGQSGFDPRQRQRTFPPSSVTRPALGPPQHPVRCIPGVISPGVKRGRGVTLTTHPHLVLRSRMSRSYTSFSPACCGTALHFKWWFAGLSRCHLYPHYCENLNSYIIQISWLLLRTSNIRFIHRNKFHEFGRKIVWACIWIFLDCYAFSLSALYKRIIETSSSSFPFPFVSLQRRGWLVAPWFLWIVLVPCAGD
jgi:hypothetical protein